MRTRWLPILTVTALLTVACGSPANPTGNASSASRVDTLTPNPVSPTAAPSIHYLALVILRGSNVIVVRDITDLSQAKTIGALGPLPASVGYGAPSDRFVSATEVSYVGGKTDDAYGLPTGLFRAPFSGSPNTAVVTGSDALFAFAWSPDGNEFAYLTGSYTGSVVHQSRAGVDTTVGSLPLLPISGCEVAPCPGPFQDPADKWDFRLSYSPDGAYIAVVQNGIRSFFRVWGSDGTLLSSADGGGATMSVWSGSSLYFRDATGVEVWRSGVISTFLRGVEWIRPKASPDGRLIVYEARQLGSAHVFIVDTTSGQIRDLGQGRSEPAFLTSRYIWYEAEPACVAEGTCQSSFPGIASGKTYIYDLQDGTETESTITSVLDVWPHAA
jgi:hypothetical protein